MGYGSDLAQRDSNLSSLSKRDSTAEENIADLLVLANIGYLALVIGLESITGRIAYQSGSSAVAAISRASIGHKKKDAIGIAMHQTGDGEWLSSPHGSLRSEGWVVGLFDPWNHLSPDGAVGIFPVDQVVRK